MGLAGRKTKQRIPNDPRNLSWANDASKFGASYLSSYGWTASTGLGPTGEGRTNAISVHQKLDMLGIGADHRKNADGTAWKQGRDFEELLRRLNGGESSGQSGTAVSGFSRATVVETEAEGVVETEVMVETEVVETSALVGSDEEEEEESDRKKRKEKKKDKKRKRSGQDAAEGEDLDVVDEGKKKRSKKNKRKTEDDEEALSPSMSVSAVNTIETEKKKKKKKHRREEDDNDVGSSDSETTSSKKAKKNRKQGREGADDTTEGDHASSKKTKKDNKKKRDAEDGEEEVSQSGSTVEQLEKSKKDKKKRKREESEAASPAEEPPKSPTPPPVRRVLARPVRAHRARFIASKSLASKSSVAMSEILGISPSLPTSLGTTEASTPYPGTPDPQSDPGPELALQKINTSSKSVMDYFREKLAAKSQGASEASTPSAEAEEDYDDAPRGGLGARRAMGW